MLMLFASFASNTNLTFIVRADRLMATRLSLQQYLSEEIRFKI